MADGKPYSFEPVYPVAQIIDVARRVKGGEVSFALAKDAAGCIGCVLEKLDGDGGGPLKYGAAPAEDLSGLSLEELGDRLERELSPTFSAAPGQPVGAIPPVVLAIVAPLLREIVTRLFERLLSGGGGSAPQADPSYT